MRYRHIMAINRVGVFIAWPSALDQMRDDLVAVEIEIDPLLAAASLGAAEQTAIKPPGRSQIMDRKGEMKRTE